MPRFPTKEADITNLARQMIAGYKSHPADFPSISSWFALSLKHSIYRSAKREQNEAYGQLHLASRIKNASLKKLTETMKACLKKSEVDVASDPAKLTLIGWESTKMPQPIEGSGQPNNLRLVNRGRGNVTLEWDSPASGGAIRNYIIQRRCQQETDGKFGPWKLTATALQNHITLTNQPQKSTLEYRVKAVNINGESIPSNTIAVVL
jgi:hypothetical protein